MKLPRSWNIFYYKECRKTLLKSYFRCQDQFKVKDYAITLNVWDQELSLDYKVECSQTSGSAS